MGGLRSYANNQFVSMSKLGFVVINITESWNSVATSGEIYLKVLT
jgi:hypothetical protein